jgi:RNA polymerase sigma-70 factor (ECF subfamily)
VSGQHAVVRGDAEGFAAWYAREAPGVCTSLTVALADPALAEEVAAEAFARAWADWAHVSAMRSPVGWVYRVAVNQARSGFRRRGHERRATARLGATAAPAPFEPDDALWASVRALPPRARTAVALRYVADLPEAEIAQVMRVARGTVAATLSSARRRLAEAMADPHEELLP